MKHRWRKVKTTGPGPNEHDLVCSGCGWRIPAGFPVPELLDEFRVPRDCGEAIAELVHDL